MTALRTWRSATRSVSSSRSTWWGSSPQLGGRGGSGDETYGFEVRLRWEKVLAQAGWTCLGWPVEYGGRGATMAEQVIFNEEYARAKAPGRVSVLGEGLFGPTLIHYGTPEQKARFLPPIRHGSELWCQGYSEPDAGSDLANVKTKQSSMATSGWSPARRSGPPWPTRRIGASWSAGRNSAPPGTRACRISWCPWTSRASRSGRSPSSPGPASSTRSSSTARALRPTTWSGAVGDGWRVALATLAFERGVALLGHQLSFRRELDHMLALAGRTVGPTTRSCASDWPRPTSS